MMSYFMMHWVYYPSARAIEKYMSHKTINKSLAKNPLEKVDQRVCEFFLWSVSFQIRYTKHHEPTKLPKICRLKI